jgi:hypothetical protein
MKLLMTAVAAFALLGFVGSAFAAKEAKPKVHKGHFVKVDDKVLTYKGGVKGKGTDHTIKIDEKTKVTIDGKEAKVTDLKGDIYLEITEMDGTASLIAASTTPPAK